MQQDATHPGDLLDSALDVEALSSEGRKRLLLASEQASAHRIERIRELLIENELDAVYIRDLSNIKWVTAFQGVFDRSALLAARSARKQVRKPIRMARPLERHLDLRTLRSRLERFAIA